MESFVLHGENGHGERVDGYGRHVYDSIWDYAKKIRGAGQPIPDGYVQIRLGEPEISLVQECELNTPFYIRYRHIADDIYVSDGILYPTEQAAKEGNSMCEKSCTPFVFSICAIGENYIYLRETRKVYIVALLTKNYI